MAKVSLDELRTRASTVDRAKVDAITEAQIEAYRAEDGYADLPVPGTAHTVESPRALRVRLGMTQPEIAAALSIPLGTWRNWEQGRVNLEPAAAALLRVVSHSPDIALDALSRDSTPVVVPSAKQRLPINPSPIYGRFWASREVQERLAALDAMLPEDFPRSHAVETWRYPPGYLEAEAELIKAMGAAIKREFTEAAA